MARKKNQKLATLIGMCDLQDIADMSGMHYQNIYYRVMRGVIDAPTHTHIHKDTCPSRTPKRKYYTLAEATEIVEKLKAE